MRLFEQLPAAVSIYEVSPRDGLQNEAATVPTNRKLDLLNVLAAAGIRRLELTSFVSPRWVPQLADADELVKAFQAPSGLVRSALCPNARGLERALASGVDEIAVFLSASETHNKKNVNRSTAESIAAFRSVIEDARKAGLRVRGYVSTLWGCPYEGAIDPGRGVSIARELIDMGCYQVSLGDTIGAGTPLQTARLLERFLSALPAERLALHMHDTRGTALANVLVGLQLGVTTFDASVGGLGGCPYAPGAAGNLATEDLVFMLEGMGVDTGIDLPALWQAGRVAESIVGRRLPGKVHQAGVGYILESTAGKGGKP